MTTQDNGGPAFPLKEPLTDDALGISVRDYFAAKAMCLFYKDTVKSAKRFSVKPEDIDAAVAKQAYFLADAMLAARKEGGQS